MALSHIQSVPEKSDTIEIISLFLNARDYTPGNLMKLYLHLSILKRFHFVQIFAAHYARCIRTNIRLSKRGLNYKNGLVYAMSFFLMSILFSCNFLHFVNVLIFWSSAA